MLPATHLADGIQLLSDDKVEQARTVFAEIARSIEQSNAQDSPKLVLPLWWLSKSYRAHHYEPCPDLQKAVEIGERCVRVAEAPGTIAPQMLVDLLVFHATTLWLSERGLDAVQRLEQAIRISVTEAVDVRECFVSAAEICIFGDNLLDGLRYAEQLAAADVTCDGVARSYALYLMADASRRLGRRKEFERIAAELLGRSLEPGMARILQEWLGETESGFV